MAAAGRTDAKTWIVTGLVALTATLFVLSAGLRVAALLQHDDGPDPLVGGRLPDGSVIGSDGTSTPRPTLGTPAPSWPATDGAWAGAGTAAASPTSVTGTGTLWLELTAPVALNGSAPATITCRSTTADITVSADATVNGYSVHLAATGTRDGYEGVTVALALDLAPRTGTPLPTVTRRQAAGNVIGRTTVVPLTPGTAGTVEAEGAGRVSWTCPVP